MAAPLPQTQSPDADPHGTEDTLRPQPAGDPTGPVVPRGSEALPRGATLGRYVVLERVASGGMGTVYAAYDPRLDRRVALKVIRPRGGGLGSEKAKARLHLEAQALARLTHPNVITVHEVGEDAERVFVAMEYVEGQALSGWLETHRAWPEILEVFLAAARGLAAAHGAGLVHRDFKPPNVLVGADGRVRVADFGIARRADDGTLDERLGGAPLPALEASLTPDRPEVDTGSAVLGTPAYMAPEQARGQVADARSDQFSWCVSLYEALFRERPFPRTALSLEAAQPLKRPAALGEVPAWLWAVLERGLSWDPKARFGSMGELIDALTRHRPGRRDRWVLGLVLAAVGVGAVTLYAGDRTRRQRDCEAQGARGGAEWNEPRRTALQAAFRASGSARADEAFQAVASTLDRYFAGWSGAAQGACVAARVTGVQTEALYGLRRACLEARFGEAQALLEALGHADQAMVDRAPDAVRGLRRLSSCEHPAPLTIATDPASQPAVDARWAELRQAAALYHLGKNAEAITALTAVAERADALPDPSLTAESHNLLGLALAVSADHKAARLHQHQAAIAAERANDDELKARAWSALSVVEGPLLGNVEEGERMSRYALAAASHLEGSPETLALVRSELAQQAHLRGDFATALAQSKAAVEALGPRASDDDELMVAALGAEALALSKLGRYPESLVLAHRSLDGCVKGVGETHPRCVSSLMNLGNTLKKNGQVDEAAVALRRAVELREQISPGSSELGASYSNLAQTLEATHQLDAALSMYRKGQAILEKTVGVDHPNVGIVHANVCSVLLQQEHWDEALQECGRAIEIFLARLPKHPFLTDLYTLQAEAQLGRGELKLAAAALEQSLARCDGQACQSQLEPARNFARARLALATSKDRPSALALAVKAREGFEKSKSQPEADQVKAWLQANGLDH